MNDARHILLLFGLAILAVLGVGCDLPGIIDVVDQDASLEPDAAETCPSEPRCGRGNFIEQCAADGSLEVIGCGIAETCNDGVCEDLTGSCDASRGRPFRLSRSELVFDVPELLAECDCTGPTGCECAEVDYKSQQRQVLIENCSTRPIFIQDVIVKGNAIRPDGESVFALDRSYREISVPPGQTRTIEVFYRPAPGVSQLTTSDLDISIIGETADTFSIPLRTRSYCVTATPSREIYTLLPGQEITFDATVVNCGTEPVTLTGAQIPNWKGPGEPDVNVSEKLPFVMSAGQSASARVRLGPDQPGVFEGTVEFAFQDDPVASGAQTRIQGAAAGEGCADIDLPKLDVLAGATVVPDGATVEPAQVLTLVPRETSTTIRPLFSLPDSPDGFYGRIDRAEDIATLVPDVVGDYVLRYRAFDEESGLLSCDYDTLNLTAQSSAPLYVELTWTTVGDVVPDDAGFGRGVDLDLYVLSAPSSESSWSDSETACFVGVDEPCGLGSGRLVLSSRTGWKPESVAFQNVDGVSFAFGAYLRNAYNFDQGARARLRVWVNGVLLEDASRTSPSEESSAPRLRAANTFWLASTYSNGVAVPLGFYQTGIP